MPNISHMGPYNFKYQNHIISTTVDKENVENLCNKMSLEWHNNSFHALYIPLIKNIFKKQGSADAVLMKRHYSIS